MRFIQARVCCDYRGSETVSYHQGHPEKTVAVDAVKADLRKQTGKFPSRDHHRQVDIPELNIPRRIRLIGEKRSLFSRTVIYIFCYSRNTFQKCRNTQYEL